MWPQLVMLAYLAVNYIAGLYASVHKYKTMSAVLIDHIQAGCLLYVLYAGGFFEPLGW